MNLFFLSLVFQRKFSPFAFSRSYFIYYPRFLYSDFSFKSEMQSTFFALSAQQEAKQAEIVLGCCGCWTTGTEVIWVWPVGCTPPVPLSPPPPPPALPVASRVRQLDAESPHPSTTLQPCCCSHPEILTFLLNFLSHGLMGRRYFHLNLFMCKENFR